MTQRDIEELEETAGQAGEARPADRGDEEATFGEAIEELEAILSRIEGEETDIDRLAAELGRASRLLEVCRAKVRKAEVEVSEIVQRIDEGEG